MLARSLVLALATLAIAAPAQAATLTIQANSTQGPSNCIPFGGWSQASSGYMGFVYKDIPAFGARAGDTLAFDLGAANEQDIIMDIWLAQTSSNGGDAVGSGGWVQVVSSGRASSRGNSTRGDYETAFTLSAPFNFTGGGLMIRFHARGTFLNDTNCTQNLLHGSSSDSSGYFVKRFYQDPDGNAPWSGSSNDYVGNFRVIYTNTWYRDSDGDGQGDPANSVVGNSPPSGYIADSRDCDDADRNTYTGAPERCDGKDNDCDSLVDEGVQTTYYRDADGDTFGNPAVTQAACNAPSGYVTNNQDCDDADPQERPGQTWYRDSDGDTFGWAATSQVSCLRPTGYVANREDCNDLAAAINPDANEVCNGVDDDCAGGADDGLPFVNYYADDDRDTYPDAADPRRTCDGAPTGYIPIRSDARWDCADNAAAINPGAREVCNTIDDNCNDLVDDGDPTIDASSQGLWHADADGDSFGSSSVTRRSCLPVTGYVLANGEDCDDASAAVNPDAQEICNSIDDDCDGGADDADSSVDLSTGGVFYADTDADGFGNAEDSRMACAAPSGYAADSTDCDDAAAAINPGAAEVCNEIDDDCDTLVDDADDGVVTSTGTTFYVDADVDGFGDPEVSRQACALPDGYAAEGTDCDDAAAEVNPSAAEICNELDDDCDELIDDADDSVDVTTGTTWYMDSDVDGFGDAEATLQACALPEGYAAEGTDCDDANAEISPAAEDIPYDGIDQDCNGSDRCDADEDGFDALECGGDDCDDNNAEIRPDAEEVWYDEVDQNCDGADDFDADGDGHTSATYGGDDCDDANGERYPGAEDAPYDGVDQDCDETGEYDVDGDGHDATAAGGDDCDDANSSIHPGAEDVPGDGLDQDCDGADAEVPGDTDTGLPGDTALETGEDDKGRCGCASGGSAPFAGLLLALGAVFARRRRS